MANKLQTGEQNDVLDWVGTHAKLIVVALLGAISKVSINDTISVLTLVYTLYLALNQAYKFHTRKKGEGAPVRFLRYKTVLYILVLIAFTVFATLLLTYYLSHYMPKK